VPRTINGTGHKVAIKVMCGYDGDKEVTVFPEEVKDCFRDQSLGTRGLQNSTRLESRAPQTGPSNLRVHILITSRRPPPAQRGVGPSSDAAIRAGRHGAEDAVHRDAR